MSSKGILPPFDDEAAQESPVPQRGLLMEIPGYDIECEIGRGGMATVYRAVQRSLNRQVAIKFLWQQPDEDHEFIQRFKKEGQTLARLFHPNIVTIHDIGIADNNQIFLAIEYLPGGTLEERIKQGLSFEAAQRIVRSIAGALGYAHRQGIIHRDVKPANILFRNNGDAVLTDFGIARIIGSNTINTMTGLIIGSPPYMSPEQAMGENITIQSDLYSLGIVFYEMLTQKAPYQADNSLAVLFKHIHDPIPKLPKQYTNLQPLINKLLAKKISDRYQSTDEFINALEAVIDNKNRTIKPEISSRATSPKLTIGISTFGALLLLGGVIYTSQSIYVTRNMETKELARFTEQHHTKFDPLLRPADQQTNLEPPDTANLPSVEIEQPFAELQVREAEQEQQRQAYLQAEHFLAQAQKTLQEELLEITLVHIEYGLTAVPDHQDLLTLREQTREKIREKKRQEEESHQRKEAAERRKIEQTAAARRRQEADRHLVIASDYRRAGKIPASLQKIEEGLAIVPDHEGLLKLKQEIRDVQAAEQRRQEEARRQAAARAAEQRRQEEARRQAAQRDAQAEKLRSIQRTIESLGRSLD